MMRLKAGFFLSLFTFLMFIGVAQEFKCQVQVSAQSIQGTNREKFENLRKGLYEFVNEKKWTNYAFKIDERIECTIAISITDEISSDEFKGKINLVLQRPVYRTSYNTTLFNYMDNDFQFQWQEGQAIEFDDNRFTSNLTSVIAYYLNIFLGLDFDSFSPNGGQPFFEKAQAIVQTSQSAREKGWKAFESMKNRYWLTENIMNSSYSNIRKAMYEYHRKGLDLMADNVENGRAGISQSLEYLLQANREKPNLFFLQVFLEAKRDEIINIFTEAPMMEKTRAVNILSEIDPSKASQYQRIMQSGGK